MLWKASTLYLPLEQRPSELTDAMFLTSRQLVGDLLPIDLRGNLRMMSISLYRKAAYRFPIQLFHDDIEKLGDGAISWHDAGPPKACHLRC